MADTFDDARRLWNDNFPPKDNGHRVEMIDPTWGMRVMVDHSPNGGTRLVIVNDLWMRHNQGYDKKRD